MPFGTASIDAGTNPTIPVAEDTISGAVYQRVKLADGTADATGAIGIDSNPLRVRSRRRGTADYDSGNVSVAAASTAVTSATVYVLGGYVVNLTDQIQTVTVTDTAGDEILSAYPLQPHETKELPLRDEVALVGIKAFAGAAGVAKLRIWGCQ